MHPTVVDYMGRTMAISPYVQNYDGETNTETWIDKNNDGESTSREIRGERDATRRQLRIGSMAQCVDGG